MQQNIRWLSFWLSVLVASGAAYSEEVPLATLSVSLASGRHFTGQLDPRTNQEQLWLCFVRGRATVRRPMDWNNVLEIRRDGEAVSRQEVLEMIAASLSETAELAGSGDPPTLVDVAARNPQTNVVPDPTVAATARARPMTARVRSLSLHAMPANWDADVELDGLAVVLFPLDEHGETTTVAGSIELSLIGEMPPGYRGDRNPRLGHWRLQLRPDDFGRRGGVFRLPFQAAHPEFDTELGAFGAVHARLTVAGQGTFESTVTTRIRPYSGFRDRLQQSAGARFLPGELHGRFD
jgi:hypothetical protein